MRLTAMSMGAASTLHVQTNLTVDLDSGLPKRGNQHLALDPPWAPLSRLFFQQPSVPWDIHESEPRLAAKRGICKCSSAAIPGGNEPPERKPGGQMSARGAFNSKRSEQQYNSVRGVSFMELCVGPLVGAVHDHSKQGSKGIL